MELKRNQCGHFDTLGFNNRGSLFNYRCLVKAKIQKLEDLISDILITFNYILHYVSINVLGEI